MAEAEGWRRNADERFQEVEDRARTAEERRLDAERRCFQAERRRLDAERRLALLERVLHEMGLASARMRQLVVELGSLAARLRRALEQAPPSTGQPISGPAAEADHRVEMADALAAAVERLRTRAATVDEPASSPEIAPCAQSTPAPAPVAMARPRHKHSLSGIARWRIWRKQRRKG